MLPLCAHEGIGVIPWSPLARGRLTREWDAETERSATDEVGKRLYRDEDRAVVDTVGAVSQRRGASRAQVALAWLLSKPVVTAPIVGVTKGEQLADAIGALALHLDPEEVAELEKPYRPHAVAGY